MSELGDLQRTFADTMTDFLAWIKAQVDEQGRRTYLYSFEDFKAHDGHMASSCHYIKLAADINLFEDLDHDNEIEGDEYMANTEAHRPLGEKWKTMHPLARWGGDWGDGNHYSFTFQGRA